MNNISYRFLSEATRRDLYMNSVKLNKQKFTFPRMGPTWPSIIAFTTLTVKITIGRLR